MLNAKITSILALIYQGLFGISFGQANSDYFFQNQTLSVYIEGAYELFNPQLNLRQNKKYISSSLSRSIKMFPPISVKFLIERENIIAGKVPTAIGLYLGFQNFSMFTRNSAYFFSTADGLSFTSTGIGLRASTPFNIQYSKIELGMDLGYNYLVEQNFWLLPTLETDSYEIIGKFTNNKHGLSFSPFVAWSHKLIGLVLSLNWLKYKSATLLHPSLALRIYLKQEKEYKYYKKD